MLCEKLTAHTTAILAIHGLGGANCLVATRGYKESASKAVPRVCMLSNVWSQEVTNAAAVGRFVGSRSRHRITVRLSPRNFSSLRCADLLSPSHGSNARPAMASCTALSDAALMSWMGKARSPVRSSKAMTPTAHMSTAASMWMVLQPASKARTTSGAAYFKE